MNRDEQYMLQALRLARQGGRAVAPNPLVGALVVKHNEVIGQGYHQKFGGPHAEVNAIHSVKNPENLKGATLYVTLEPCRHHGKTPPCWDLSNQMGFKRVVVGSPDPFQQTFQILSSKTQISSKSERPTPKQVPNFQIEFLSGSAAEECRDLNKFFFTWVGKKRPFITVKVAMSADSFVAGPAGEPVRFTSQDQDRQVHQLRAEHQAIMVGTSTVLNDNPQLNVRHGVGVDPLRIVLDRELKISVSARVFKDSNVLIATQRWTCETTCPTYVQNKLKWLKERQIQVWESPTEGYINLEALFSYLAQKGIASVLVEPGPTLYESLKKLNLVDELIVLRGERELGEGLRINF